MVLDFLLIRKLVVGFCVLVPDSDSGTETLIYLNYARIDTKQSEKKNPTLKNNTFRSLLDSSGGSGGFGIISSSGEKVTDICINVEYLCNIELVNSF